MDIKMNPGQSATQANPLMFILDKEKARLCIIAILFIIFVVVTSIKMGKKTLSAPKAKSN